MAEENDGKYLTAEEYRTVRAFVNLMHGTCKSCMKRYQCERCDLKDVERVLHVLDHAKGQPTPKESAYVREFTKRIHIILKTIRDKGPCRACDIDLQGHGDNHNKWFCLHSLVRRGLLRIVKTEVGYRAYAITPGREESVNAILGNPART